jgi:hypothetical protein
MQGEEAPRWRKPKKGGTKPPLQTARKKLRGRRYLNALVIRSGSLARSSLGRRWS